MPTLSVTFTGIRSISWRVSVKFQTQHQRNIFNFSSIHKYVYLAFFSLVVVNVCEQNVKSRHNNIIERWKNKIDFQSGIVGSVDLDWPGAPVASVDLHGSLFIIIKLVSTIVYLYKYQFIKLCLLLFVDIVLNIHEKRSISVDFIDAETSFDTKTTIAAWFFIHSHTATCVVYRGQNANIYEQTPSVKLDSNLLSCCIHLCSMLKTNAFYNFFSIEL